MKVYEGTLAVRFEGEHRTLKMSPDRFEEHPNRHLLRKSLGRVNGIYQTEDRRYFRRPRHRNNEKPPRLLAPEEDFRAYRTVRLPQEKKRREDRTITPREAASRSEQPERDIRYITIPR